MFLTPSDYTTVLPVILVLARSLSHPCSWSTSAYHLTRTQEDVSPTLASVHLLPACFRIDLKIWLFAYKSLNGLAPTYLSDLLQLHVPSRSLRYGEQLLQPVLKIFFKHIFSPWLFPQYVSCFSQSICLLNCSLCSFVLFYGFCYFDCTAFWSSVVFNSLRIHLG